MDCENVKSHLQAYLHRELSQELTSAVESHILVCKTCKAETEELKLMSKILRQWKVPPPDIEQAKNTLAVALSLKRSVPVVEEKVDIEPVEKEPAEAISIPERLLKSNFVRLLIAASIVVFISLGLLLMFNTTRIEHPAKFEIKDFMPAVAAVTNVRDLANLKVAFTEFCSQEYAQKTKNVNKIITYEFVNTILAFPKMEQQKDDVGTLLIFADSIPEEELSSLRVSLFPRAGQVQEDIWFTVELRSQNLLQEDVSTLSTKHAILAESSGNYYDALQIYQKEIELGKDRATAALRSAFIFMKFGNIGKAKRMIGVARMEESTPIVNKLTDEMARRINQAAVLKKQWIELKLQYGENDYTANELKEILDLQMKASDYQNASITLGDLIPQLDAREQGWYLLQQAWCYKEVGELGKARVVLNSLLDSTTNDKNLEIAARFELFLITKAQEKFDESISLLTSLIKEPVVKENKRLLEMLIFSLGYTFIYDIGDVERGKWFLNSSPEISSLMLIDLIDRINNRPDPEKIPDYTVPRNSAAQRKANPDEV